MGDVVRLKGSVTRAAEEALARVLEAEADYKAVCRLYKLHKKGK